MGHPKSTNKGQTLVIAIMVMFILAIVATIFIALVARNLFRSERYSHVDSVAQIAEAGVRYADEMLTTSEEGADWRPVPDNVGVTAPGNWIDDVQPTPDTATNFDPAKPNWQYLRDEHPDFKWIRAYWPTELFPSGYTPASEDEIGFAGPTGGYTTFLTGEGRFLLRVSYSPNPSDALSKYIKIESIGRWGIIERDPSNPAGFDPTTLRSGGNVLLRREVTAYKPIGVTDYLRFITNKNKRSTDFALGAPGFHIDFGRSPDSKYGARGGPIRVNGNLTWHGNFDDVDSGTHSVDVYLRGVEGAGSARIPVEKVEVSGDITMDAQPGAENQAVNVMLHALIGSSEYTQTARASSDSDFSTFDGFYRDGRDTTDAAQMARGVKRIEPPLVEQPDPTGTTTRYRLLTLSSGERIKPGSRWINLGKYGWGRGVYINNLRDKQDESETLVGGYTLRTDWLKPNNLISTYWVGPYYVPPGCIIVLHPTDTDGDGQADFTITRTDVASARGNRPVWYDASGSPRPEWGATITMPYPDPKNGRILTPVLGGNSKHIDGNGVIYAEGNIRIRGMLPEGMQLTVVSNENIYIEGNILKYRDPDEAMDEKDPYHATAATNTCGLALLARRNVCVNTTQFFAPLNSISADDVGSDAGDGRPPFHVIISNEPNSQLRTMFEFGPYESDVEESFDPQKSTRYLFVRHSGQYGSSYINMWLNPDTSVPGYGILHPNVNFTAGRPHAQFPGLPEHVWGIGDPNFSPPGTGIGNPFVTDVFPLTSALNASLINAPGAPNLFQVGLDQTTYTRNNYLMGGLAVQPMDIRIEAIIYAQEGSFFVIPGTWFNPNPGDKIGGPRPPEVNPMFPYFGQALDTRIIIDGAVSESIPAAVSDVEEWMTKWGRIPEFYGSSDVPTAHPGEGLTFLYDDHAGWPLKDLSDPDTPIRWDNYGRILPLAPRLPVSGSLIYFGDVM